MAASSAQVAELVDEVLYLEKEVASANDRTGRVHQALAKSLSVLGESFVSVETYASSLEVYVARGTPLSPDEQKSLAKVAHDAAGARTRAAHVAADVLRESAALGLPLEAPSGLIGDSAPVSVSSSARSDNIVVVDGKPYDADAVRRLLTLRSTLERERDEARETTMALRLEMAKLERQDDSNATEDHKDESLTRASTAELEEEKRRRQEAEEALAKAEVALRRAATALSSAIHMRDDGTKAVAHLERVLNDRIEALSRRLV